MARVRQPQLPEEGEPLVTSHGTVMPVNVQRTIEVPSASEAVGIIAGTRRKLVELPVAPRSLNPVACVCMYTLFGLDNQEISIATGIPVHQIHTMRMSTEYAMLQRSVVDTVMAAETGEVKDYLRQVSGTAARKVVGMMESPHPDIALKAARDVLDRSGHRPVDVHELRSKMEMGLVIEVVERRADDNTVTLEGFDYGNRR